MNRIVRIFGLMGLVLLAACSTPKDSVDLADKASFDPALMEAYLRETYEGRVVGFSYAINHDQLLARVGAWGYARRPEDGGLAMTPETRMHVASVSKNLNAVYFLNVLRQIRGLKGAGYAGLDDAVSPWLPDGWVQGMGFAGPDGVTFAQLLTHRSGLRQLFDAMSEQDQKSWGNDWAGLEFVVANGAIPGAEPAYKNANHALFRILTPQLIRASGLRNLVEVTEATAGPIYVELLNQFVFAPIGIARVDCRFDRAGNYAYYYDHDGPRTKGFVFDRSDQDCGGHAGLQLSALELARYLAYVRYSDAVLDDAARAEMYGRGLGWWGDGIVTGDAASARLYHGGDWYTWYDGKEEYPEHVAELHTCVLAFPRKVEAVLLINSSLPAGTPKPCDALVAAYEAALVAP